MSPRAHSHVGNKPGGRVREIYTLTESGVLLAGQPFLGGGLSPVPGRPGPAVSGHRGKREWQAQHSVTQQDGA